jgi:hypothetical protein
MLFRRGGTHADLARKYARETLAIRKKLTDKRMLARSYTNLGWMLSENSPNESEGMYRKAIELLGRLVVGYPSGPYLRRELAEDQFDLADLLAPSAGRWGEVERLNRQGLAHYERLA